MKLKTLELKNYKAHKNYVANFKGNSIVQGSKGSGKTSLKDAFTWLLTGRMVDDPTPVDENGEIVNHLTISVACEFKDGTKLKIESQQRWVKDVLRSRHNSTYFVNDTPMLEKDYQSFLDDKIGTLEQRRILLDPSFFAHGDGLRVTGKTSKTAIQRRREIVINVAGVASLEDDIAKNEEKAKQAKFAISQFKKDLDDANAGIESLYNSKIDVSNINKTTLENQIKELEDERTSTIKNIESLSSGSDTQNALKRALSDAQTAFSEARSKYSLEYHDRLEQAQKPLNDYKEKRRELQNKIQQAEFEIKRQNENERMLVNEIDNLENNRKVLLEEYTEVKNNEYVPNSTNCQTCGQSLPTEKLREAEARFNKQRSEKLENILRKGKEVKELLDKARKEFNLPKENINISGLREELNALVEPKIEKPKHFNETKEHNVLQQAITDAQKALDDNSDDDVKALYQRTLDNLQNQIKELQDELNKFNTNNHLDNQIEIKGKELQGIAEKLDEQKAILEECNEFTRTTLAKLETTLEEKFDGIRFKMFEYTLDGDQKDTCITYAKTNAGYISWENLSGGQKRSATIKLANAFSKAWEVKLPLWIDDTQIYSEDELNADTQLIRITEVPHKEIEVK